MMRYLLLIPAVALGLAIAWMDSRPNWDDTGMTVAALVLASGVFGFIDPRRPWIWALGISVWTPGWTMFNGGDPGISIVVLFAYLASYLGAWLRLAVGKVARARG